MDLSKLCGFLYHLFAAVFVGSAIWLLFSSSHAGPHWQKIAAIVAVVASYALGNGFYAGGKILDSQNVSPEQVAYKIKRFRKSYNFKPGLGLEEDNLEIDRYASFASMLASLSLPFLFALNSYELSKSVRFVFFDDNTPSWQTKWLVSFLESTIFISGLFRLMISFVLRDFPALVTTVRDVKSYSALRSISLLNLKTLEARMNDMALGVTRRSKAPTEDIPPSWESSKTYRAVGFAVLIMFPCVWYAITFAIAFAAFVEKVRGLNADLSPLDDDWKLSHLSWPVFMNTMAVANQIINVVDVENLMNEAVLKVLFTRGDANMSVEEQKICYHYVVAAKAKMLEAEDESLFNRLVVVAAFGADTIQKLAVEDEEDESVVENEWENENVMTHDGSFCDVSDSEEE